MKSFTSSILFVVVLLTCSAQEPYAKCTYSYFKNKKVSTSSCFDKDNRFGKAIAFSTKGEKIYERELRNIGGHSTVWFTYHENGAVKKAEWRSAPDGGIQWYSNITTFSEEGTQLSYMENNYDDSPFTTIQRMQKPENSKREIEDSTKIKTQTIACAIIHSNEFWYINRTKFKVVVSATRNNYESFTTTLLRGDTIKGGEFILAQHYDNPEKYFSFSIKALNKKVKRKFAIVPIPVLTNTPKEGLRKYYYGIK
jgi:hypothetical protein